MFHERPPEPADERPVALTSGSNAAHPQGGARGVEHRVLGSTARSVQATGLEIGFGRGQALARFGEQRRCRLAHTRIPSRKMARMTCG